MSDSGIATDAADFAGRLRAALKARSMSQRALADSLGLESATQISHWATGRRGPSESNLRKAADALEVPADWLAGEGARESPAPKAESAADVLREAMGHLDAAPVMDDERRTQINADLLRSAESLPPDQAADYARLMAFMFLATTWNVQHGWDITLRADLGEGRVITVEGNRYSLSGAVPAAPPRAEARAEEPISAASPPKRKATPRTPPPAERGRKAVAGKGRSLKGG